MEENYKTQAVLLLAYLEEHGNISGRECEDELGIMNYKGRIFDLRQLGHRIDRRWVKVKNRYGRQTKYARYYLMDNAEEAKQ